MDKEKITQWLADCFADPHLFVHTAFLWGHGDLKDAAPDVWQDRILIRVRDDLNAGKNIAKSIRYAVASGHGIGKSALVAWLILWSMATRPNISGVVTANTASQLSDKTWRELAIWHKRLFLIKDWFKWTATKFYQKDNAETWFISAIPWSKERPEAFAGLHAKHVIVIFDEASAIDDVIYETTEGAMTTTGAMWFCFGNPTRNSGRFFEIHHKLKHRWICEKIDSRTAKMTNKEELQLWIEQYGEDSDFIRYRVKGEFPRSGSNQLISSEDVEFAIKRGKETTFTQCKLQNSYAPKIIGVDVARFGDDQSVIAKRQGSALYPLIKRRGLDTMTLASLVAQAIDDWNADMCFVDDGGVGGGVVDRLHQLGYKNVVGVPFGSAATQKDRFFNKRSEMWGLMRNWIPNAILPDDSELRDDLTAPEYGFSGDRGQIQLEKKEDMKKRGLASPDCGDALALTFAFPVSKNLTSNDMNSRNSRVVSIHDTGRL